MSTLSWSRLLEAKIMWGVGYGAGEGTRTLANEAICPLGVSPQLLPSFFSPRASLAGDETYESKGSQMSPIAGENCPIN
ncbi:MAG: hypothetical protein WHU54_06770 [Candidatus Bathyarchaeia archaeon]